MDMRGGGGESHLVSLSPTRRTRSVRRFYSWSGPTPRLRHPSRRCHVPATSDGSELVRASACESVRAASRSRACARKPLSEMCVRDARRNRERGRRQDAADDDDAAADAEAAAGRRRDSSPRLLRRFRFFRLVAARDWPPPGKSEWRIALVLRHDRRRDAPPEAEVAGLRSPSRRGTGSTNATSVDRSVSDRSLSPSSSLVDFYCHSRT